MKKIVTFAGARGHQLSGQFGVSGARQRRSASVSVKRLAAASCQLRRVDAVVTAVDPVETAPQVPVPLSRLRVRTLT